MTAADKSYVFWQNLPTHIQSPWVSALAAKCKAPVWMVTETDISEARRNLGWTLPDYSPAILEIGCDKKKALRVIQSAGPDAVHIFSGIGAYPGLDEAFRECLRRGLQTGLLVESKTAPGIMGVARKAVWRLRSIRYRAKLGFILAIGEGPPLYYFRRRGFDAGKIFEFGYFTPLPLGNESTDETGWNSDGVRLIYIGLLARAKGIAELLSALARCRDPWQLRLIGSGPDCERFKALSTSLGLDQQVAFCGAMVNADAMRVLQGADVLILPSLGDGWGAVINEALLRGVAVICSDQCGAKQVVDANPALGSVYGSTTELRLTLESWIGKGRRTAADAHFIRNWCQRLHPAAAADYFLAIMEHTYFDGPRPKAPWLESGYLSKPR